MARRRWAAGLLSVILGLVTLLGALQGAGDGHRFEGQCQQCHTRMPHVNAPFEEANLVPNVAQACERCHQLPAETSHPVGVVPQSEVPLRRYLDTEGRLSCVTCHDVHKAQREQFQGEATPGLLRGHVRGRAFCAACHNEQFVGASWRHSLAVSRAHAQGRLAQRADGAPLDEASGECVSCHAGDITSSGVPPPREGMFQHGSADTIHPVGVTYPTGKAAEKYVPAQFLPETVRLFNGRVSCLSCHSMYSDIPGKLVMEMTGSALCLSCHRK